MGALKVVALFGMYGAIGYGGDWAFALLDDGEQGVVVDVVAEPEMVVEPDVAVDVAVESEVVVDVRPTIVSRVRVQHQGSCSYETSHEFSVAADGLGMIAIDAGAGDLHVEGQPGLEEVVIVGLVCASEEAWLDDLRVTAEERSEGRLVIGTHYPDRSEREGDHTASIDLTVLVPLGMNVDIDDSSGDIDAIRTGDLRIDDSSGSVRVSDAEGDVWIDDSSGGVEVRGVRGDLAIEDGSGNVEAADVGGDVLVSDGSGSIDVRNVGGDFTVARDGSGSIRHSGIEGRIDVPERRRRGGS